MRMRKIKFFLKGSEKEKKFLSTQKNNGYILENVKFNIYNFSKNKNLTQSKLQVEFINKDFNINEYSKSEFIKKIIQKKLLISDFNVVYSYIDTKKDGMKVLNETKDIEVNYLERLKNNLLIFNVIFTIILVLLGFILSENKSSGYLDKMPIYIMFFIWLVTFLFSRKLSRRIESLLCKEPSPHAEITIIINNDSKEKPNIETSLKYLGLWRYIVTKKNKHYFRLSTYFSEDKLKNEISSFLNISEDNVQIISNLGLFPIGFFY